MQKPVAIIGTSGLVTEAFRRDTTSVFAEVGHNTGNLAFQHAVWSSIANDKTTFSFDFDAGEVRERCGLVCIPAANFLYSGFDLGGFADRLAATELPLMVLGLGAQAFRDIAEVRLQPGTERLLRLFAERCARIAVRGRYTAAVLERHGVTNFDVLGCPSNFINPDPRLGESILDRWRSGPPKLVAYAPTFYSYNADLEGGVYTALGERVAEIVAQDPLQAVALARGDRDETLVAWLSEKSGFLAALPEGARGSAIARLRAYLSAEAWLDAYRRLDAVIGTRIHGVNLGWQAGRAALVISYDLRTEELAETMGIPCVKAEGNLPARLEECLAERVEACANGYDARRRDLAARFAALLDAHGVTPASSLHDLGKAGTASAAPPVRAWGFLEQYNRNRIAGWVAASTPTPPAVRIRLNGQDIGVATPRVPRPEIGANAWAFELPVPAKALTRDVMRVEATIEGSGTPLRNSGVVSSFASDDIRKVLRGQEGWLFLQNDTNGVLDQVQGKRLLTDAELDAWATFLASADRAAAGCGARVFHFVAPNKECVFAERLPAEIRISDNRPVEQIASLLRRMKLKRSSFVYPLEALRNPGTHPVYPKGDSHWSDYGAAVALGELWRAGKGVFPGPEEPISAESFHLEYRNADLLSKLGGTCVEPQPVLRRRFACVQLEDNGTVNTGRVRRYRSAKPDAQGRLLLVHDSFGEWLIPYLAERFAETVTIWGSSAPVERVKELKPTVIVFERAERFLLVPPRPL